MKRIVTLILAAGLILGATSAAQAVDFKVSGLWQHRVSFADRNFEKHNGDDKLRAASRLRTQIDVIASESLKGVMFFEIGHQNWGKSAQGAALGTDGKEVKVRYSYVDWVVPQTDVKVRMGLQKYTLPNFTGIGSPILDADGAGITISNQFTENVGTNLFWLRAANDNDPEMTKHDAHDALDFIGLTVPLTFDGVKVTPWGMGGIIGQDSFKGSGPDMTGIAMPGMLPLGGDAAIAASSDKDHGSIWYGGIAADVTYFEPFRFALDAAYGSVDMGTSKYKDKIDGVMGQLDGMKDFSYDPTRDAAYEQYKNSYTRQAKLANENAQANASAISGGYGSSYGTQAGQSAYQNAMAGLSSATNSLYSQALNQYTQKKSDLQNQLSGYQQAEAQDYEKYQTNYQNWENQRNYYQNAYNQAASESQAKKSRGTGLFGTILSVAASLLPFLL